MIMSLKQRKIKFEPRIKLNHNIYMPLTYGMAVAKISSCQKKNGRQGIRTAKEFLVQFSICFL